MRGNQVVTHRVKTDGSSLIALKSSLFILIILFVPLVVRKNIGLVTFDEYRLSTYGIVILPSARSAKSIRNYLSILISDFSSKVIFYGTPRSTFLIYPGLVPLVALVKQKAQSRTL